MSLKIDNLTKEYANTKVFANLNYQFEPGQIYCIFGPSGLGKTTFLNCIAGLEPFDFGSITYFENELNGFGAWQKFYQNTAFVFQDFGLWPHKTALQNVILAPKLQSKKQSFDFSYINELFSRFGLSQHHHSFPAFLSGGQAQRVALIRALAVNPKILLLDEITSALDRANKLIVAKVLQELASLKTIIILVSHDIEFLEMFEHQRIELISSKN